jgi:hypothetical protein
MMSAMLSMALIPDKEKAKLDADKEIDDAKAKSEGMKDRVILLKAKLIQMRDQRTIKDAADFLRRGNE